MSSDLLVRAAHAGDTDAIVGLQHVGLGDGTLPRTVEAWKWKHVDNPFGPSFVIVAEVDRRLIGLRAFMRWSFIEGDRVVSAVRAVDTVTHPDWQGRGIFTRLTKALCNDVAAHGVAFVFNTPNSKSRPGYLKMGWQDLGRITVWGRPLLPWEQPSEDVATNVPDAVSTVRELTRGERGLSTPVSQAFLRWRYGNVPGLDYRAVVNSDAVAIGRRRRRGRLLEAMITEVIVGEGHDGILRAGRAVRDLARNLQANYAIAVAPLRTRRALALVAAGFMPVPRAGPHFTVRPISALADSSRALSLDGWALGLGDVELF